MLVKLLLSLFKVDYKNHYFSKLTFFSEILVIIFTLTIYYYTSKAFSLSVQGSIKESYFNYIIIGEIFLSLPLYFLDTFIRKVRQGVYDGTLQTLLIFPFSLTKVIFILGISGIMRELLREFLTLLLAIIIFNFSLNPSIIFPLIIIELLFIPLFILLGLITTFILLYLGRGDNLLGYLNTISSVLAGALFPLNVLPTWLSHYSLLLSPYTQLLENIRGLIRTNQIQWESCLIPLMMWYFFLIPLTWYISKIINKKLRQVGFKLILTT